MSFEDDIFISYAHIDDQALTDGQKGWISEFHHALQIRLAQLRGEKPKIWRDLKLTGNDDFGEAIVKRLPNVALLLSVFSPRYVKSEWCLRELREFYRAAEDRGGVKVGEKYRIFKVIKTPVAIADQPPEMQALLGYEFYKQNPAGRPIEFDPRYGSEAEINYWIKLNDLAYDVYQLLDLLHGTMQPQVVSSPVPAPSVLPPIYLAETTYDLTEARENIRRELQQRGHLVLPDEALPYSPDFTPVVTQHLAQCRLSIHLVGRRYGIVPEGAEQSVVELQHQLATQHEQQQSQFSRLVWMPVGLEAEEPRQQAFIQALQDEAELLQTSLEDLKTIIQDTLNPTAPAEMLDEGESDRPPQIYLICDQRDLDDYDTTLQPLEDYLFDTLGFDVIPSVFDGTEADVRRYHHDSLVDCDAAIIYWNSGSETWLRTKLRELQQAPGLGRKRPILAKAIYISGDPTPQKQRFRTREAIAIKQFGAFTPTDLDPFVTHIQQAIGGAS